MNLTLGVVGLDRDRHRRHPEPRVSRNVLSQETSAQQSQVQTKAGSLERYIECEREILSVTTNLESGNPWITLFVYHKS